MLKHRDSRNRIKGCIGECCVSYTNPACENRVSSYQTSAPHGRRRRTDATLALGMERARRRTETMIPESERPPNADAPAGGVVGAQRAVSPRRSRRHWRSPADGASRGWRGSGRGGATTCCASARASVVMPAD